MSEIKLRSDIRVDVLNHMGGDIDIADAAWVSEPECTRGRDDPKSVERLIGKMMKLKHGTPFEAGALSAYVEAPIFVFRQWMKHRIAWGYNETSGRYKVLKPEFYVPPHERPIVEPDGFKPMSPVLADGSSEDHNFVLLQTAFQCRSAWESYTSMIGHGIAREVARNVLPFCTYSSMRVVCNPRSLMLLISKRTRDELAAVPSFPQWEIEQAANKLEDALRQFWPVTHAAFVQNGRVAP